jgi:hypothetical protein
MGRVARKHLSLQQEKGACMNEGAQALGADRTLVGVLQAVTGSRQLMRQHSHDS